MKYFTFFILLVLSFYISPCFALEITFRDRAEVKDKHITLGDIVTFSDNNELTGAISQTTVSRSPAPGKSLVLNSEDVIKSIYRKTSLAGDVNWLGSPAVNVVRKGQLIDSKLMTGAILRFLEENRDKLPQAKISFIPKSVPQPFLVPVGELSWKVIPSHPSIVKSGRFSLIIKVDDKVRENISVTGKIQALAPIAVATADLKKGQILTPQNTALLERNLIREKDPCFTLRKILGKRVKHSIRAGNVVQSSFVEFPPLVRKGQLVKIILSDGPLYLTATGIAHKSGKLNDIIRVQNTTSRKLIFCRIAAPGIVEVNI